MNSTSCRKNIAAIDLGSQTFRLAVVKIADNSCQVLASELKNVRLAQNLYFCGRLNKSSMERGIKTLRHFLNILHKFKVSEVMICGTAALRNASNAKEFLNMANKEGFNDIKILSAEEEALISVMGVYTSLPYISSPFLVVDVGGGSSEFILATKNEILYNESLNLGAVNLTEKFIRTDPPLSKELEKLRFYINQKLSGLSVRLPQSPRVLIGVGGTATTMVAMTLKMKKYDPRRIRGYIFKSQEIDRLWNFLSAIKIDTRKSVPGLESTRADIILSGIALLRGVLNILGCKDLCVSDGGLLLGLLRSLINKESINYAETIDTRGIYI